MTRVYKNYTIKKMVNTANQIIYCAYNQNDKLVNATAPQLRTVKGLLDYKIKNNLVEETGFDFLLESLKDRAERQLRNVTEALAREKNKY